VDCNVAGDRSITTTPTRAAPDQGVRRVSARLEEGRIYLWVLVAAPREDSVDPECRGAFLGYPPAGHYDVFYREPDASLHELGTADVPEYEIRLR
jgi:hypothetical protein